MRPVSSHSGTGYLAILLLCLSYPLFSAFAADNLESTSGVPRPVIAAGQGETCVAEIDFMRRNHMDMLKHQRDETTFKGLRDEAFSLKDCISCHAVKGPDGRAVTASDPKHFCRSCHDYAAVSIDCFQCHASRPESVDFPDERRFSRQSSGAAGQNGRN